MKRREVITMAIGVTLIAVGLLGFTRCSSEQNASSPHPKAPVTTQRHAKLPDPSLRYS